MTTYFENLISTLSWNSSPGAALGGGELLAVEVPEVHGPADVALDGEHLVLYGVGEEESLSHAWNPAVVAA